MGLSIRRRFVRRSLTSLGIAAAAASALVGAQGSLAFATTTTTPDVIVVDPNSGGAKGDGAITLTEGNGAETLVGTFTDPGNTGANMDCSSTRLADYDVTVDWGDQTSDHSSNHNLIELFCSGQTGKIFVGGIHTWADSGSDAVKVSVVDNHNNENGSTASPVTTLTATVNDATLTWRTDNSDGPFISVEGQSVSVSADFNDSNNAFPTEGGAIDTIKGTIDWGDGTSTTVDAIQVPSNECEGCTHHIRIKASHVYDSSIPAGANLPIKVTATDDGGKKAADSRMSAQISDATLTAGGTEMLLSPIAGRSFTAVVGTFSDDAGDQAKVADFTSVVIKWGDNTLSAGTVSQTASGKFKVSGTHTYGAAGNNSITATVTDEEGSTVTLHATAQVAAAPAAAVVLPATGQPHQPATPTLPVVPLALLLGLSAIAGGVTLTRLDRIRH